MATDAITNSVCQSQYYVTSVRTVLDEQSNQQNNKNTYRIGRRTILRIFGTKNEIDKNIVKYTITQDRRVLEARQNRTVLGILLLNAMIVPIDSQKCARVLCSELAIR